MSVIYYSYPLRQMVKDGTAGSPGKAVWYRVAVLDTRSSERGNVYIHNQAMKDVLVQMLSIGVAMELIVVSINIYKMPTHYVYITV